MHPDAERLFAVDHTLRREADEMLRLSGIGAVLSEAGLVGVGSYAMQTMVWRDLDFETYTELDRSAYWSFAQRVAQSPWVFRAQFEDNTRNDWNGLYWGFLAVDPAVEWPVARDHPLVWKLDVWQFPPPRRRSAAMQRRQTWDSLLTAETRSHILAIKEAVCRDARYGRTLFSVQVYEAVLEGGVRSLDVFEEWWARRYGAPPA